MLSSNLKAAERIAKARRTPLLIIDRDVIRQKYGELQKAMGNARIYYALKANPQRRIVQLLQELGANFEISSEEELNLLLRLRVSPQNIISSNPVKSEAFIGAAYAAGVKLFAFDSFTEVEKLSKLAPHSKVYVRLSVSNQGSQWPLSGKFGVEIDEAVDLLVQAAESGLEPYGITFHVGSQCTDPAAWVKASEKSKVVWGLAEGRGIELRMLNVGGGFPIKHAEPVPSITHIAQVIRNIISRDFPNDVQILIEPGRALVGEAGTLVTTVIGKAVRNGQNWLYLDVGVFNGLMESIGAIPYPMAIAKNGPASKWVLAGPSCDSFDVISTNVDLPEPEIGDKVYIMSAGAYTTAYASRFNGFCIPKTYFV